MENTSALYYDGISARPFPVRVLLFDGCIHLHNDSDAAFIQSFSLVGTSHNQVGNTHYLYVDGKGMQYLQFTSDHPMAEGIAEQVSGANPGWATRLMSQKAAVLATLVVVLSVGLYFLVVTLVPFIGTRVISIDREIKIGDELHRVMLQEARLLGATIDTAGTQHLQAFADGLNLSNQYPIRLTLVKSDIVNAYALPGGNVVVYTGILKKIKTPEALAALLAHESTHINQRHSLRSLLRNAANGIIISIIFSDASGISGALATNADALSGLSYSRSLETEADSKGMDLMVKNKMDVKGMRQLMQTLDELPELPGAISFLSTHPMTKERIQNADRYMKSHAQTAVARPDLQELFKQLKKEY